MTLKIIRGGAVGKVYKAGNCGKERNLGIIGIDVFRRLTGGFVCRRHPRKEVFKRITLRGSVYNGVAVCVRKLYCNVGCIDGVRFVELIARLFLRIFDM